MKLYRTILNRYAPGATADDALYVYGMAAAWTAVDALKRAGKDLTRASLAEGARHVHLGREPVPAARHRSQDGG